MMRSGEETKSRSGEEKINGDLDIATTSAARAIYLAGFTYLRLRLYASTPESDIRFVTFIAASFCLSILSAALSLIFKFFLDRCDSVEQKLHFDQKARKFYVKGAFVCFLLALILFCVGLSRIGWVYFAGWNSKYISFALFLFGGLSIIITTLHISLTKQSLDSNEHKDSTQLALPAQRCGESLDVFLSKQMDVIIERSIFIGGIAINGVTFYVEVERCQGLGRSYLFFMSISAICSLFVSGILSTLRIALQDIPSGPSRIRYAYIALPLGQACFVIYVASFLFLTIGLMFIGYGVHYDRDKTFTLCINAIGVGGMLLTIFYSGYCHAQSIELPAISTTTGDAKISNEEHVRSTLTSSKLMGTICNITSGFVFFNLLFYSSVLHYEQEGTTLQSQVYLVANAVALILCICISVFDSILQLFTNDLETFSHRSLFLHKMSPIISFTQFGTFVAMAGVFVSYGLGAIVKFRPNSYIPAFTAGVGGVMVLIGVLVFAIQRRNLPLYLRKLEEKERFSTEASGNPLQRRSDSLASEKEGSLSSTASTGSSLPKYKAERYAKRPSVLSILTGCVMFFGGFAYTSIINLSYDDKPIENRFVLFMSFIFIFSYSIVVWGVFYLLFFLSCPTPKEKIIYVIITSPVYKAALFLSGLALFSTIVGFCLMGYTKTYAENYHAFSATMIGATGFSSLLVTVILSRVYLDYKSVTEDTKIRHRDESHRGSAPESSSQGPNSPGNGSAQSIGQQNGSGSRISSNSSASPPTADYMKVLLNQLSATVASASFIAGNLLYELLFINPLYRYSEMVTLAYIIFAALTFTSAVSAVVITNITLFLLGTLSQQESILLADKLVNHGIQLFVFCFTLSALLTWMTAAALLPHATYLQAIANRWPLTIFCAISVGLIIFSIFYAYALVVEATKEMREGKEAGKGKGKREIEMEIGSKVISEL